MVARISSFFRWDASTGNRNLSDGVVRYWRTKPLGLRHSIFVHRVSRSPPFADLQMNRERPTGRGCFWT